MPDLIPEFEFTDELGQTRQYSGTVGTTPIYVPALPSIFGIDAFLIRCPPQSPNSRRLQFSLNGGANWMTLGVGEYVGWSPRRDSSNNLITQVMIRGNSANVEYEILINFAAS
ncbi:MAG: hypothetical protein QXT45_04305 [Candidatus Bilamarchaeaceae archaeon]